MKVNLKFLIVILFIDAIVMLFPLHFLSSEKERQQFKVSENCGCLWAYLADLRASEGKSHVHYNILYDPSKHNGPILPPAASLAPIVWPQFLLRWACPDEAQAAVELDARCRQKFLEYSELEKVNFFPYDCLIW